MKTLELSTLEAWRAWLAENHDKVDEIWLVYYKKESGIASLDYAETRDEALCFGWVDSLIKRIDDTKYVRKFTPRKDSSKWSKVNKTQVQALTKAGRMTEHGLKKVEAAKRSGSWDNPVQKPSMDFKMPPEFTQALKNHPQAEKTYNSLSPSHQKQYLGWIVTTKRPETRQKRINEASKLLIQGKKLGLK
jgi:uncharacterized protein YdeI (YjbR/CyaY-like superfamily)